MCIVFECLIFGLAMLSENILTAKLSRSTVYIFLVSISSTCIVFTRNMFHPFARVAHVLSLCWVGTMYVQLWCCSAISKTFSSFFVVKLCGFSLKTNFFQRLFVRLREAARAVSSPLSQRYSPAVMTTKVISMWEPMCILSACWPLLCVSN